MNWRSAGVATIAFLLVCLWRTRRRRRLDAHITLSEKTVRAIREAEK